MSKQLTFFDWQMDTQMYKRTPPRKPHSAGTLNFEHPDTKNSILEMTNLIRKKKDDHDFYFIAQQIKHC